MWKFRATIVRWIDGDTCRMDIDLGFHIWIRNREIRLYGCDTAETRTKDKKQKFVGKHTLAILEARFPVGTEVTLLSHDQETGKYGRVLGDFRVGEELTWVQYLKIRDLVVPYGCTEEEKIEFFHNRYGEIRSEQTR